MVEQKVLGDPQELVESGVKPYVAQYLVVVNLNSSIHVF